MSALATALKRKDWDLAALCLLVGLHAVISSLPADAVEGLLDSLEKTEHGAQAD